MARRLLYVGADDEIADLVSRVRAAAPGDEVGFVVPQGAVVFQTPLNFRLINQLCARQGVTAGIVSPDQRTQQLARDAGLGTFTSVSAYEQGIPMGERRPLGGIAPVTGPRFGAPPPGPVPAAGQLRPSGLPSSTPPPSLPAGPPPGPALGQDALTAPSPWTARQPQPGRPVGPTPPAPAPPPETFSFGHRAYPAAGVAFTADEADAGYGQPSSPYGQAAGSGRPPLSGTPSRPDGRPGTGGAKPARKPMSQNRRRAIYAGIAGAVILMILIFLIVAPSAQVTVTFAEVPLTVSPTIQGTPDAGTATQPDHLLSESVSDTGTMEFTATPSGTQTNPATSATADVVLTSNGQGQCPPPGPCSGYIAAGTLFQTSGNPAVVFAVTEGTDFSITAAYGESAEIPVVATSSGASANVPAGDINACAPSNDICLTDGVTVKNPAPATGGTDAEQVIVATAGDIAGWTSDITQDEATLTAKAKTDLVTKAGADKLAIDPNGGGELISFTVSPDVTQVTAGTQEAPATVTVTMTAQAAAYNPASIQPVVLADLKKQLSSGATLVPGRLSLSAVDIIEATPDGNFALSVTATDFSQPDVNLDALRGQLTGRGPGSVEGIIAQQLAGVTKVTVEESPFGLPYMPLFSGSIKITEDFVSSKPPVKPHASPTASPSASPTATG